CRLSASRYSCARPRSSPTELEPRADAGGAELADPPEVEHAHVGVEALGILAAHAGHAAAGRLAEWHGGHRAHVTRSLAEPGQERAAFGGAAGGPAHRLGLLALGRLDGGRFREVGRHALAPDAQGNVRHGEVLAQVEVERVRERREIARAYERDREAVNLLADDVVLLAEAHELGELAFDELQLLAQRKRLALGERNGAPAVRMGHLDRLEELGMLVEEARVGPQEDGDLFGAHRLRSILIPRSLLRRRSAPGLSSTPDCRRPPHGWSTCRRASEREPAN